MQERAARLRDSLGVDAKLGQIGAPTLVGSAALGLMVARDIDLTVVVKRLGASVLRAVSELAAELSTRPDIREVVFRNDTGRWNTDEEYPDGLYLRIECADELDELWTLDIWFVDEPERQPDLNHLRTIGPRITVETQAAILDIKRATQGKRSDRSRLPSYEIYEAVLGRNVRTPAEFARDR